MNLIDLREKKINSDANLRMRANDANKERQNVGSSDLRRRQNNVGEIGTQKKQEVQPQQKEISAAPLLKAPDAILPIVWEVEEFEYRHKDGTWFLSAGIIGLAFLTFAAMTRNFLMIPLIFIFAFVIYVFALKKPRLMEFEISGDGVAIRPIDADEPHFAEASRGEGKFFPFKSLTSFWIFERGGGWNELSFETDKLLYPHLKIPLAEDVDVKRLREILGGFVEEKEQDESLSEILARWLKF